VIHVAKDHTHNTVSSWKTSGLYPRLDHPPVTLQKTEDWKKHAIDMDVFPHMHLTSALTDQNAIDDVNTLIERRGKIKGKAAGIKKTSQTAFDPKDKIYELAASLALRRRLWCPLIRCYLTTWKN